MTRQEAKQAVKANWPVLIFLAAQTVTAVIWGAKIDQKVEYLTEFARRRDKEVHRLSTEQYKEADAERVHRQIEIRLNEACSRIGRIEALLLKKN